MRYASIRSLDTSNGYGVGASLFVQGCPIHCPGCFNTTTWDFNGGKEWTEETKKRFLELLNRPYIKRCSILGGEPLASQNLDGVLDIIKETRILFGNTKTIWIYSGYTWESIIREPLINHYLNKEDMSENVKRQEIISLCDVMVDGRYEEDKRDITLAFKGSTNQRVIDVKESLRTNSIVKYKGV